MQGTQQGTQGSDDDGGVVGDIWGAFVRQNLNCHNKRLTERVYDEAVRPMLPQLIQVLQLQVRGEPQEVRDRVLEGFEHYLESVLVDGAPKAACGGPQAAVAGER